MSANMSRRRQSTFVRLLKKGDKFIEYGNSTYKVWTVAEDAQVINDRYGRYVTLKVEGLSARCAYNLDTRVRLYHDE